MCRGPPGTTVGSEGCREIRANFEETLIAILIIYWTAHRLLAGSAGQLKHHRTMLLLMTSCFVKLGFSVVTVMKSSHTKVSVEEEMRVFLSSLMPRLETYTVPTGSQLVI